MRDWRRLASLGGAGLALGLLLVLGLRAWWAPAEQAGGPARPASSRPAGPGSRPAAVEVVDLSRLNLDGRPLADGGRDPFRYRPAPPPPKTGTVPPMYGPPEPLPPPPPAPPPPIPLKFVGVVETGRLAGRVAVLSDIRGGIFYGKEGDIIDGRYRLLRVATELAELAYTDGQGRQALRLAGQ